jgi:hypothetical protein
MKGLKLSLVIMAAALLTIGLSGMAYAFHDGGVADCSGCHSMHSPVDNTGGHLLIRQDQSSTCLSCHAHEDTAPSSYHVMTYPVPAAGSPPVELTPGGDFAWLLKTYNFPVRGTPTTENGETHGHNIYAGDFGIGGDSRYSTSPGGTYPAGPGFQCTSCHDPHGKWRRIGGDTTYTIATSGAPIIGSGSYGTSATPAPGQAVGVYRLLYGGTAGSATFPGIPAASAPSGYNRSEVATQTRVAYGVSTPGSNKTTWGLWCATCHTGMHSTGNYVHPVDQNMSATVIGTYNAYISSSSTTGRSQATAYLSLVPFMEGTDNYATLKSHAVNNLADQPGPVAPAQVSCLSCHRAHASGWPEALRWNPEYEFITFVASADSTTPVWPGTDNVDPANGALHRGRTELETRTAYYLRPATLFGAYQRSLCNKCHAQD